jgi:hypothetical protein
MTAAIPRLSFPLLDCTRSQSVGNLKYLCDVAEILHDFDDPLRQQSLQKKPFRLYILSKHQTTVQSFIVSNRRRSELIMIKSAIVVPFLSGAFATLLVTFLEKKLRKTNRIGTVE